MTPVVWTTTPQSATTPEPEPWRQIWWAPNAATASMAAEKHECAYRFLGAPGLALGLRPQPGMMFFLHPRIQDETIQYLLQCGFVRKADDLPF